MDGFFSGLGIGLSIVGLLVVVLLLFLMDLGIAAAAERLGLLKRTKPLALFGGEQGEIGEKQVVPERGVPDNKQLQRTRPAQAREPRR